MKESIAVVVSYRTRCYSQPPVEDLTKILDSSMADDQDLSETYHGEVLSFNETSSSSSLDKL